MIIFTKIRYFYKFSANFYRDFAQNNRQISIFRQIFKDSSKFEFNLEFFDKLFSKNSKIIKNILFRGWRIFRFLFFILFSFFSAWGRAGADCLRCSFPLCHLISHITDNLFHKFGRAHTCMWGWGWRLRTPSSHHS